MANSRLAIGSSLNLRRINNSVSSLGKSVRQAQSSTGRITKSLLESNRDKRKSLALSSTMFRRRREATLRREREDLLEAGSITGAVKRTARVASSSTKGFLGRILDFLGTLLVGWGITNLPTIIKLATDLTKRMQKYFGILQGFVSGVSGFLLGLPSRFGEIFNDISNFRFESLKDIFDRNLERMKTAFQRLQNGITGFIVKLRSIQTVDDLLDYIDMKRSDFNIPGIEKLKEFLGQTKNEEGTNNQGGANNNNRGGGNATLPDPKSAEMYRIAAALTTEGNSDQGYADMLQVVANRVAHPGYGSSYTEVLAAGKGGDDVAFAGVWARPGGPNGLRNIQTLSDAVKWAGRGFTESDILRVISLMTDPARQASAAKFVGGALEFRGSPPNVKGNPKIAADANGFIPGSVWRGTPSDNQFLIDPSKGDPMLPGGPAKITLPKQQKATNQKVSFNKTNKSNNRATYLAYNSPEEPSSRTVLVVNRTRILNEPVVAKASPHSRSLGGGSVNSMESALAMQSQYTLATLT